MSDFNFIRKVKVTDLKTNCIYFHYNIPKEHAETLKLSPNLKVEIVERGLKNDESNEDQLYSGTIDIT